MRSLVLAASLALASPPLLAGPTFTVDSTADQADDNPGDGVCHTLAATCTLRAAVMEANHNLSPTIVVPAGHYVLSLLPTCMNDSDACGNLNVTSSMTITGAGAASTLIDATGLGDGIFDVSAQATLTLSRVTLEHASGGQGGVSVGAGASLTMSDSRITDCHATGSGGGARGGSGATLTLTRVTIDACSGSSGGAVAAVGGILFVDTCTLSGNSASGAGGAVYASGPAYLSASTVSGNGAATGGGVFIDGSGDGHITNCTISGNHATGNAGGLDVAYPASTSVENTTITANQADSDFNGSGMGGGIYSDGGFPYIHETLLAGNFETIFAFGGWGPTYGDCAGGLNTSGENVLEGYDTTHCAILGGHFTVADPKLGPLADNGGLTRTHLPLAGSPAIDGGTTGCNVSGDQRGVVRPIGAHCDLGAVELEPEGDANGDGVVSVSDVFYLINFLFAGGTAPKGRANVNADSAIDVTDVFYLVNFLFAGGPAPH